MALSLSLCEETVGGLRFDVSLQDVLLTGWNANQTETCNEGLIFVIKMILWLQPNVSRHLTAVNWADVGLECSFYLFQTRRWVETYRNKRLNATYTKACAHWKMDWHSNVSHLSQLCRKYTGIYLSTSDSKYFYSRKSHFSSFVDIYWSFYSFSITMYCL